MKKLLIILFFSFNNLTPCAITEKTYDFPQNKFYTRILKGIIHLASCPKGDADCYAFYITNKLKEYESRSLGKKIKSRIHPYPRKIKKITELNDPIELYYKDNLLYCRFFLPNSPNTRAKIKYNFLKKYSKKKTLNGAIPITDTFTISFPQKLSLINKKIPFHNIHEKFERHTAYYVDIRIY